MEKLKDIFKTALQEAKKFLINEQTVAIWKDFLENLSLQIKESDKVLRGLLVKQDSAGVSSLRKAYAAVEKKLREKELSKRFELGKAVLTKGKESKIEFSIKYNKEDIKPFTIKVVDKRPKFDWAPVDAQLKKLKSDGRLLKASLITLEETTFDYMDDIDQVIQKQIEHLIKLESELDGYIGNLSALQITMLRKLLEEKYGEFK